MVTSSLDRDPWFVSEPETDHCEADRRKVKQMKRARLPFLILPLPNLSCTNLFIQIVMAIQENENYERCKLIYEQMERRSVAPRRRRR